MGVAGEGGPRVDSGSSVDRPGAEFTCFHFRLYRQIGRSTSPCRLIGNPRQLQDRRNCPPRETPPGLSRLGVLSVAAEVVARTTAVTCHLLETGPDPAS